MAALNEHYARLCLNHPRMTLAYCRCENPERVHFKGKRIDLGEDEKQDLCTFLHLLEGLNQANKTACTFGDVTRCTEGFQVAILQTSSLPFEIFQRYVLNQTLSNGQAIFYKMHDLKVEQEFGDPYVFFKSISKEELEKRRSLLEASQLLEEKAPIFPHKVKALLPIASSLGFQKLSEALKSST